ncbi:TonB-dependent receptor [Chitinophaga sp.]|uniref:SusC/RagA family TonB-linked outer membrane protein n=1 Tax=Chitinophaga sp. TaxID=1869181 RepID=UPI002C0C1FC5|nr:TonB-dependent receptor [Chitinophaga sp.]HWV67351.1 TonB-dependent receptor [Chitinophaga sp.]
MKVTAFLLLVMVAGVHATGVAQKLTLSFQQAALENVFREIEQQSGMRFLYNDDFLKGAPPVTLRVKDADINEVMKRIIVRRPFVFKVVAGTVIITPVDSSPGPDNPVVKDITVTGIVKGPDGTPLPGASVSVKGKAGTGVATGNDGRFKLTVANDAILVISFIGLKNKEVPVNGVTTLEVVLEKDAARIDEVIVVGYGTMKKSDLTGAITRVRSEEINAFPSANVFQALSGRAPGVQVLQNTGAPGAPVSMRIRGTNSIQGSNEPLYVVDGFPTSGNPTILNNADIESIEVLKDASATAIYGSRGANGVVIITTKRGKAGRTNVNAETSYSSQTLIRKLDMMNAKEYAAFYNEQAANDGLAPYFTPTQVEGFGKGFDWQDLVFKPAPMKTINLNINGGNEKTRFAIGGSIFDQDGIVNGSNYKRYALLANVSHDISSKFSVSVNATLSRLKTDRKDSGGGSRGSSMISAAVSAPPTLTPYNDDGSYKVLAIAYPFVATDLINPLNFINEQRNTIKANLVLANAALMYKPVDGLTIKVMGGIENRDDRTDNYTTRNFVNSNGNASVVTNQITSLLNENTITYNKTFNRHSISVLAGFTYQDFLTTSLSGSGNGFLSDVFETSDLSAADIPGVPGSGYSKAVLLSYLGRVNYNFNDKYLVTASIRRDGSSRYTKGNKWGYFPSAALAWRVSNEDFLKGNAIISNLKLRTSWGLTGSQAISPYATLNQLGSGKTVFNDEMYNTFSPGTRLPGNLKWETTAQLDFGMDLGLLDNRVNFTADYYIKNTRDLLNTVALPSSMGFTTTIQNVGEVQNKGLEFGIDTRVLDGNFKWDINANLSFNRNKVVKLYGGNDVLGGNINAIVINDVTSILREGRPIGQYWGYLEDGYDEQGKIRFRDLDKSGTITTADKTYIGNPNPDFIYGLNSAMSYKDLSLTVFLQGVQGNDLFNASAIANTIDYGFGLNMPRDVYNDHWTPANTNAKYPVLSRNTTVRVSNRFVENGSYLRLKNIQLAYNLPLRRWGVKGIQNGQLYVSGQNLLTFTKYSWWDPEVNSNGGGNSTAQGIDFNSYPSNKSFTIGIRAGF